MITNDGSQRVANAEEDEVQDPVLKAGGRRAAGGLAAMRKRKDRKKQGEAAPEAQAAPAPQEGDAADADAAEGNEPIEPYVAPTIHGGRVYWRWCSLANDPEAAR